jgi:hypothetical protein
MSAEQELRDYVGEHLGDHNIGISIDTAMVDGHPRLLEFSVSINKYGKVRESLELMKEKEWTERSEKKLVSNVKAGIDKIIAKKEREELGKSILKKVADIFNKHGFNAKDNYNGTAVFHTREKVIMSSSAQVIFNITTSEDNSKLIIQYKDSNQGSGFRSVLEGDCFTLSLSEPSSLGDGLITFVKKIAADEANRRLEVKRREIAQLEKWKKGLDDEDAHDSFKHIMPGFRNS